MVSDVLVSSTEPKMAIGPDNWIVLHGETVLEPNFRDKHYWAEAWRFRELLGFLAWRDTVVRYKQSIVGVGWAILRPLLNVLVYTVVFGVFASLPANGVPYTLLILAAMLPWQFFANSLGDTSSAVISNSMIVGKIYFPRIILPVSAMAPSFVELGIGFVLLLGAMVFYGIWPTWRIVLAPLLLLPVITASLGLGILTSALYVRYRDMRFLVPFITQIGFFLAPVAYLSDLVPARWRWVYELNPLVGSIEGFRWAMLGPAFAPGKFALAVSVIGSIASLILGIVYFRRVEREFADVI
jgi:lipopolysaccharide transport system permease protein